MLFLKQLTLLDVTTQFGSEFHTPTTRLQKEYLFISNLERLYNNFKEFPRVLQSKFLVNLGTVLTSYILFKILKIFDHISSDPSEL